MISALSTRVAGNVTPGLDTCISGRLKTGDLKDSPERESQPCVSVYLVSRLFGEDPRLHVGAPRSVTRGTVSEFVEQQRKLIHGTSVGPPTNGAELCAPFRRSLISREH